MNPKFAALLAAALLFTACESSESESHPDLPSTCTENRCYDSSSLLLCNPKTGQYTTEFCASGCENNACKSDPSKNCTQSTCKDAETLLSCNTLTGVTTEIPCASGCENGACVRNPVQPCTHNSCKDAHTLISCNAETGIATEMPCANGCENNACKTNIDEKCAQNSCKDANTLISCDTTTGIATEVSCANGCKDNACQPKPTGETCTADKCKDAFTLNRCDATSMTYVEEACPYYCYNDACVKPPVPCEPGTLPRCDGNDKLIFCDNLNGEDYLEYTTHCIDGRTCQTFTDTTTGKQTGGCLVAENSPACLVNACKDLHTLVLCNNGIETEQTCAESEYCIDDKCMPRYTPCASNAECKDGMTCIDGRCTTPQTACQTDAECGGGEYCIDKICVQRNEITACLDHSDCADDELCRHGLCYLKSNMELKTGDPCDWSGFQEYCDDTGNIEYKCGYDKTVEENDCSAFGGCAVYIKPAYSTNKPVRNAICRGDSHRLKECTKPGVTGYQCVNVVDPYFSYFMSVADACTLATDGTMIHLYERDQYNCGSELCDESTGLCPGNTPSCPAGNCACTKDTCKNETTRLICNADGSTFERTCPAGCEDGKCKNLPNILGNACFTESDAFCNEDSLIYCKEQDQLTNNGIWTSYACPTGFTCIDEEAESVCAETCTEIGSKSSICGESTFGAITIETVCTQVGSKRVYLRDVATATPCPGSCLDNKICAPTT